MNATENINAIFEQCMSDSTNPRQKESLRRIHKACEYLQNSDIRITPSSVERYCIDHDWDGPKAQSIRNSPALSKYLALRKSGQVIRTNNKTSRPIPLIADETLRAYVNLLIEERDQAIADKARIVKGLRNIPGIPVDDLIRQGFGAKPSPATRDEVLLPPLVIEALGRLFDEQRLKDCGLKLYRDRLVQILTGNVLLEKKHVEAIQAFGKSRSVDEATSSFPGIGAEKASTIEHKE